MKWWHKILVNKGSSIAENQIEKVEATNPKVKIFREKLYTLSIPEFMKWLTEEWGNEVGLDLSNVTLPYHIMELTNPLGKVDEFTDIIIKKLDPRD